MRELNHKLFVGPFVLLLLFQEPFDLVLTQDFMVVINDNVSANRRDSLNGNGNLGKRCEMDFFQ